MVSKDAQSAGKQRLRNATLAYFGVARKDPALYQLMFGPKFADGGMIPQLRSAREEAFGELKRIIAELLGCEIDS
ncbi:TetR-like C-terminal domain-containing protein, partial [Pseudomonas gingeri]|uniref:TetR-like C-terminal domain-containing protein n=1 Tax=Pseudomonas gingeri TaxID=117681 RepID=UPI0015A3C7CD